MSISLLILVGLVLYVNPSMLIRTIAKTDLFYLFLGFMISNITVMLRVVKWNVLLSNISFKQLFPVQMLGMSLSNLTPGKIGEPIKAVILKLSNKLPVSESLPTIIWERIMDVVVLVLFAIFGVQFIAGNFFVPSILSISMVIVFIILLILVLYKKSFGIRVFNLLKKIPILNKIDNQFIATFYKGVKILKSKLFLSFILTFIVWFLDGAVFYFVLLSFGLSSIENLFIIPCILALSILIGICSSLPSGVGSTEVVMIILLGALGIEKTVATATVMLARFLTLGYGMLLGYLSFLYLSRKVNLRNIVKRVV